jgi:hypothetical protein
MRIAAALSPLGETLASGLPQASAKHRGNSAVVAWDIRFDANFAQLNCRTAITAADERMTGAAEQIASSMDERRDLSAAEVEFFELAIGGRRGGNFHLYHPARNRNRSLLTRSTKPIYVAAQYKQNNPKQTDTIY